MKRDRTRRRNLFRAVIVGLLLILALMTALTFLPAPAQANVIGPNAPSSALQYVLIGWNDLGMHCMNLVFKNLAVLPPFNTLWAQVIQRGDPPQIITTGVTVSYSIENNTYSVGKTDFWTYAYPLFGANLQPNIGLAGKGLTGNMDPATDHFTAVGIPLTPFLDNSPNVLYPYNLADLVAKDGNGNVLATTKAVAPVSTEMHCDYCHADGKEPGGSTGNVETNILTLHDEEEGTHLMNQRPVLCAKCHGSNALGMPGNPNLPNLSLAMHGQHEETSYAGPGNLPVCYNCHPGVKTQCLRDVMYQHGMTCTDCHGNMSQVANPNRRPWIDVPRCATCHQSQYAENAGVRYRDSVGHGGLYCEACHSSTHAIVPSTQYNDNIQNIALQGYAGALGKCTVCHATQPTGPGPHGLMMPAMPTLIHPKNGVSILNTRPTLRWSVVSNASIYRVQVHKDSPTGQIVLATRVSTNSYQVPTLVGRGTSYYWRVRACDLNICSDWTPFWSFTVTATGSPIR